jgi:gluconokinase
MIIVMMGICGSGKTTVGRMLATRLGVPFFEGDDYHTPENVAKMADGQPLTDDDRRPWLNALATALADWDARGQETVVSCSALRRSYRDLLSNAGRDVVFVFLEGAMDLVRQRMSSRQGHFMPTALIESQIEALEDPRGEPNVITGNISDPPDVLVTHIMEVLKARRRTG